MEGVGIIAFIIALYAAIAIITYDMAGIFAAVGAVLGTMFLTALPIFIVMKLSKPRKE